MSASKGEKIVVTVLFVLIGLPPGLCSLLEMPVALRSLWNAPRAYSGLAPLVGVLSLIGFAIFELMLWLLIRAWRRE